MNEQRLGIVGILATGGTALAAMVTILLRMAVIPAFAGMFRDFGGELPALTRLALGWSWPVAWALLLLAIAALAAVPILPRPARFALALSGCALGAAEIGATVIALYLPIFALADIQ